MVSSQELQARIREFFRFDKAEISGLVVAVLVTAFIFSFRDWGAEVFDLYAGLGNLLAAILVVAISFVFRLSCQKIYGLVEGHKSDFRVWWLGILIALVVAFLSAGKIPLVMIGAMVPAFMIRQRLGEFRYGFSYWANGMIGFWGVLGNMILAILFSIGLYFFPGSFFFTKGLHLNLIMGFLALLPLPQLDGLNIFFSSRTLYIVGILMVLLAAVLLLSKTAIGLVAAIIVAVIVSITYVLISSEK